MHVETKIHFALNMLNLLFGFNSLVRRVVFFDYRTKAVVQKTIKQWSYGLYLLFENNTHVYYLLYFRVKYFWTLNLVEVVSLNLVSQTESARVCFWQKRLSQMRWLYHTNESVICLFLTTIFIHNTIKYTDYVNKYTLPACAFCSGTMIRLFKMVYWYLNTVHDTFNSESNLWRNARTWIYKISTFAEISDISFNGCV